jgi:hypothetical protein
MVAFPGRVWDEPSGLARDGLPEGTTFVGMFR